MQNIQQLIDSWDLNEENDKWIYSWGSGIFASAKVYKILVGHSEVHLTFKWLWKSNCQPKHKVFFWLLVKDRLSTRNILRRKNMHLDSYDCVLCNSLTEETADHLFVDCPFATMCWDLIGVEMPLHGAFPELTSQLKDQWNSPFFMDAIILMCWTVWTARNNLIFKGIQLNLADCRRIFMKELLLLQYRIKPSQENQFNSWIQNLV